MRTLFQTFTICLLMSIGFIHHSQAQKKVHLVKKGETLYSIARKYDTNVTSIQQFNPNVDIYSLPVGFSLWVPGNDSGLKAGQMEVASSEEFRPAIRKIPTKLQRVSYRVKEGDSYRSLSERLHVPEARLRELNPQMNEVMVGEVMELELLVYDAQEVEKAQREALALQKAKEREQMVTKAKQAAKERELASRNNNGSSGQTNESPSTTVDTPSITTGTGSAVASGSTIAEVITSKKEEPKVTIINDPGKVDAIAEDELEIYDNPIYQPAPVGYKRILLVHTIKQGETLDDIDKKYKATKGQLISWNEDKAKGKLPVGETLIVGIEDIPVEDKKEELPDNIRTVVDKDGNSILEDGGVVADGMDHLIDGVPKEQPKKKSDGPNISRAKVSDVIYTGKGLDEESATEKAKTEPKEPIKTDDKKTVETEKKNDGPNISRARTSDVIYTGRGLDEKVSNPSPKTVEETLENNVRRAAGDTLTEGAITNLPKGYEGAVKAQSRNPEEQSPYGVFVVWHNEARIGSYIKLTNPESGNSVFAKVIGKLSNTNVEVQCSPKVCEQLGIPSNTDVLIKVTYNN